MSAGYRAVLWNRQKRIYDAVVAGGIALYCGTFIGVGAILHPNATAETLIIRALGTCAFLLLHVVLCIGPLARLDRRFLPMVYNRRHLGVTMFLLALGHGIFSLIQFHALGDVAPFVSLLTSNTRFGSVSQFPFQVVGFIALTVLFVMAATSHDFWLHNLSPAVWKRIHMLVYPVYGLLVAHVALGALQSEGSSVAAFALMVGVVLVVTLHLTSAWKERRRDANVSPAAARAGMVDVCAVNDIPEKRAFVASIGGERVAVFRYDGRVSAVSNVCRHQNGPLGEGKIIDGCITCPWHGYQYLPECGASPPPFTDKVETYDVEIQGGRVLVNPRAHAPGTRVEPARIRQQTAVNT